MNDIMKTIVLFLALIMAIGCSAQTFSTLDLSKTNCKFGSMRMHNCFDKNNGLILLESVSEQNIYYRLNCGQGSISNISVNKSLLPISFWGNDTLVVWHKENNLFLFYDVKKNNTFEIRIRSLASLLSLLSHDVCDNIKFNDNLTECMLWNNSVLVRLKYATNDSVSIDTIFQGRGNVPITNVFYLSNNYCLINSYDIKAMEEYTCLIDSTDKRTLKRRCDFLVNDVRGDYCIAWENGICTIMQFDEKSMNFNKVMRISSSFNKLYGRIGFVSPNIIAWYTGIELDYTLFEPLLNQQNLLKINEY